MDWAEVKAELLGDAEMRKEYERLLGKCPLHPKYKAVRKPKSCPTCWAIYNRKHALEVRGRDY